MAISPFNPPLGSSSQSNYDSDRPNPIIQVQGLYKRYGRLTAVKEIDFSVTPGEVFGSIGLDGAGKTTTFHILGGIMESSQGRVRVLGKPPRVARLDIGYLTQVFSLYLDLSIDQNLRYIAGLCKVPDRLFTERRARYLRLMDLEKFGDRLAGELSGGMKQKLAPCCSLIYKPEVLLLDEPTTGVDPVSRQEFWDVLAALASEGVTIVVATPYLDETERCNRVALMYGGQIQQIGPLLELKASLGLHRLEVRLGPLERAEQVLQKSSLAVGYGGANNGSQWDYQIVDVQTFGDRLDVLVQDERAGKAEVCDLLDRNHLKLDSIDASQPTLENVFVTRLRQQGSGPPLLSFPRSRRSKPCQPSSKFYPC